MADLIPFPALPLTDAEARAIGAEMERAGDRYDPTEMPRLAAFQRRVVLWAISREMIARRSWVVEEEGGEFSVYDESKPKTEDNYYGLVAYGFTSRAAAERYIAGTDEPA